MSWDEYCEILNLDSSAEENMSYLTRFMAAGIENFQKFWRNGSNFYAEMMMTAWSDKYYSHHFSELVIIRGS